MDPKSDPQDPGRLYAKNEGQDPPRRDRRRLLLGPVPADAGFRLTPRLVIGLAIMLFHWGSGIRARP